MALLHPSPQLSAVSAHCPQALDPQRTLRRPLGVFVFSRGTHTGS